MTKHEDLKNELFKIMKEFIYFKVKIHIDETTYHVKIDDIILSLQHEDQLDEFLNQIQNLFKSGQTIPEHYWKDILDKI